MAFSFSSSSPLFQSSQTLNLTPTPAQQPQSFFTQNTQFPSFFQPQSQLQPQPQPQQQQQQQVYLFTADRSPAGYNTKFEDLHSDSQKFLRQIEERIMEYKDESQRLEQNSRLYGSSMSSDSFELDASHILQELGGISAAMDREKFIVQELMSEVKSMMWNTEVAVRSYMIIRPRFVRPNASSNSDSVPASNALVAPISSSPSNQLTSSSMVPLYDFYSGFPKRPSPFMQSSLSRFEKYLAECRQWVEELEQLLLLESENNSLNSGSSSLQSLPNIMSNVHDFFVHVAAKVESLHQYIESMKTVYLTDQRRHGDGNDPFLEADRRETAKQEAAARRVHPTLHLPAVSAQPSTHGTGLYTSSAIPASSAPQQTVTSSGPTGGGFSLFGTPSSTPAATTSSFLFSTPSLSASTSSLFGSPQPTTFVTAPASLFGSSQTPSHFGSSTSSLISSPAIGSSSLFATPSLTLGAATGSGASFGAASKSARPKSRTTRRSWGIISLMIAYLWQLYTLWILVNLHEAVPGRRYNRYVELAQAAFGERLGVWLALFPTVYLSAGTATALILVGGETMKLFFQIVCGTLCTSNPLTTVEWYLVFTSLCIVLSQLPNLNSIAGLSLIGAITAVTYTTVAWVLSISQTRPASISYEPLRLNSFTESSFSILNSLGIIAFAFRGHNLALEIQATMPSTFKHPAHVPMWRGAKVAYVLIAMCLFPVAIGGFWAYGNLMPAGGMLNALYAFHNHDIPRGLLATTFLLVVFNCLSSFQIYSMPVFDSFEAGYTSRTNRPCSIWVRSGFRIFYGFISFFIGVAFPFLSSIAGLLGGLTLPVTFAYPCFMWVLIKKPQRFSFNWYLNWSLGILGIAFSLAFSAGGVWSMINSGLKLKFFKPN